MAKCEKGGDGKGIKNEEFLDAGNNSFLMCICLFRKFNDKQ
jgi:hypothetical protein